MWHWIVGIGMLVLIVVIWLLRRAGTPEMFARTLIAPLIVGHRLEKEDKPNSTDKDLAWSMIRLRMSNPLGCRELSENEARDLIALSPNMADVLVALCVRDLTVMKRPESIHPAAIAALKFLVEEGFEDQVLASNVYRDYQSAM